MTRRASRPSVSVPRVWLLPALILTTILGLTAADVLSRSLVLDLVAWWPVWALLTIIVVGFGRRRIGRVRVGGLVSILVAGALVIFTVGHLSGWPINPSSTRHLVGPQTSEFTGAELIAVVEGQLQLSGGSEFLYEVDPLGRGGDVGLPTAVERSIGNTMSVALEAPSNPGFDTSAGWEVSLSGQPVWSLTVGGDIAADLSEVLVRELSVIGSGSIVLGHVDGTSLVETQGAFTFQIPTGTPGRVIGDARVPESWAETSDGWRSPEAGMGWVITVPTGSVVFIDQG